MFVVQALMDQISEILTDESRLLVDRRGAAKLARKRLKEVMALLDKQERIAEAKATEHNRLTPEDGSYGVHMTHCYGFNYDDGEGEYSCKYGEDHICPAALHADPLAYYDKHFPD